MFKWLRFVLPRNWGRLSRAVMGDINYRPPRWAVAGGNCLLDSMQKRPGIWASTIILVGLAVAGNWYWREWQEAHQPQPRPLVVMRDISGNLTAPGDTPVIKHKPVPQPAVVHFTGSIATLEAVGKPGPVGLTLAPAHPGEWKWTDDRTLAFMPSKDWPAGIEFTIKLDPAVLPKEVRLKEPTWKFTTRPLVPNLAGTEFYTDPKEPALHQVVAELKFNHPVELEAVRRLVSLEAPAEAPVFDWKGQRPKELFTIEPGDDQRNFWVRSARIAIPAKEQWVKIVLGAGLTTTNDGKPTTDAISGKVRVPDMFSGFSIGEAQTRIIRTDEGEPEQYLFVDTNGYVEGEEIMHHLEAWLLPKDRPASKQDEKIESYDWPNTGEVTDAILKLSDRISLKRVETEKDENAPVATSHAFKFLSPRPGILFVRVSKGVNALGGFQLGSDFAVTRPVPEFPKEVEIIGRGGLLALNGERKLSIKSRGIQHLRFTLARVPLSQVNHLARFSHGDFESPSFNGYVDEENIAHYHREVREVAMRNEYEASYVTFDMGPAVSRLDPSDPDGSRGMFFLSIEGVKPREGEDDGNGNDGGNGEAASPDDALAKWVPLQRNNRDDDGRHEGATFTNRFILVTDLGLLVKRNADGTRDVFVQSVQQGEPVGGVTLTILAKNGEFLGQQNTDADGHARFANVESLQREKTPVAFTARLGNDVAFIRFRREDRGLDFSRFDTGGVLQSENEALDAFLFTERGVYRPGDAVHVGGIVRRRDWGGKIEGLPLEFEVTNSKDQVVETRRVPLPADGFLDLATKTDENDPTGIYAARLFLIQGNDRRVLLNRRTFRVEEFQPDRMKLDVAFSVPDRAGWIAPGDVTANVSLQTLFGMAAADRRVKAKLELSPAEFVLEPFPDFTFHNRLREESNSVAGQIVELGEKKTGTDGIAAFDLALKRFENACFSMTFFAEGFEPDGGRSVRGGKTVLVSPLPYVVGYKADGDLNYIGMDSQRGVRLLAVGPDLKPVAQPSLTRRIFQIKHVSVLTKQQSGSYAYVSTRRETMLGEGVLAVPAEGANFTLPTGAPGEFRLELRDEQNRVVCACPFTVVGKGDSQRSLERNAELELKLARGALNSGESLEMSLSAPFTGAGLITIEREKVLGWQWFKSPTTTSTQHILAPPGVDGTAYVNVSFVRALDSPEIFMSPLSYAVEPFVTNPDARKLAVELDAPKLVKPGTEIRIGYKTAKPCRIVVFAVDAGIHQITDYKVPQPLTHFFRKRALEVETMQLLDLILPEFSLLQNKKAFGGDEDALKMRLNPFKRRKDPPVVFWSGFLSADSARREVSYAVPDYFAGKLNIMAVAVAMDDVGAAEASSTVRGPMVLTPNVPLFAVPGDEFTASLAVANNLEGANAPASISLVAAGDEHLEVLDAQQAIEVVPGREGTARFHVRVKDQLGGAEIVFRSTAGGESMERRATLSVRPASPYLTHVQSGYFRQARFDVPVKRVMYPQFRKTEATLGTLPLGLARGLDAYLREYPHGCSEQITSRAMSRLLLADEADFGFDKAEAVRQVDDAFALLRSRQHSNGGFGYWDSSCGNEMDYLSVYVTHFLTEAGDAGYAVPSALLEGARNRMRQIARATVHNLHDAAIQSAAIYLLTRGGEVTTNYLLNLRDTLDRDFKDKWQGDLVAAYVASTYALLQQEKEAGALFGVFRERAKHDGSNRWHGWYYEDPQVREAEVFALTCRHFPKIARGFGYKDIGIVTEPVAKGRFNTISSAWTILALKSYAQLAQKQDVKLSIGELPRAAGVEARLLVPPKAGLLSTAFGTDAAALRFTLDQTGRADLGAFYQVVESGFDTGLPSQKIADGIEVIRELLDDKGKAAERFRVGDSVTVRIRVRNIGPENLDNVAVLDLLPGGFEVEPNNLKPGRGTMPGADFVEVREDRNVFFCDIPKGAVKTFQYRIKPVAAGTFIVPPVFAEQMYDRGINGRAGGTKLVVDPAP